MKCSSLFPSLAGQVRLEQYRLQTEVCLLVYLIGSYFLHRWLAGTLVASSALHCLPSLPREPPTYISAPSTRRLCPSPQCPLLSSAAAIPPVRPHRTQRPSSIRPPPLRFECPTGTAPARGPPDPAAPYATTRLSSAAPSTRNVAKDGGPEAQNDATSHVSTSVFHHIKNTRGVFYLIHSVS